MKQKFNALVAKSAMVWAVCGLLMAGLTACEPKEEPKPVNPTDTTATDTATFIVKSFPKKHLLEEFTGQDCGYCPYGMDCVHDFVKSDTNWIVVLHHYGYSPDHFSVAGSKKITTKLAVNGAPTITINRAATQSQDGKKICFHPGYLPSVKMAQFDTATYASIVLENSYDAASRVLNVHVSGEIGKQDAPKLKLTLLVKESGMIDYQADYNDTFEGWQEFRHANAVRAFLTDPLGDTLTLNNYTYSADYTLTLNSKWVPENCMIVAALAEDFKPVVQAAQLPVVADSKGGADILHGGITAVPVEDYYPEPGTNISPASYTGFEADTITTASAYYTHYSDYGFTYWEIQGYSIARIVSIDKTSCVPFTDLFLFTELGTTTLPLGTYPLDTTMAAGTAFAGFRDDENVSIEGSSFYYVSKSYLQQGYLVPSAQWLIADGTLVIREDGWELTGHARNGSDIHLVGNTAIKNGGRNSAPRRAKQCNRTNSETDHFSKLLWLNSL